MNTPEMPVKAPRNGWVFYDGDCDFCLAIIRLFSPAFTRHGFASVPLQEPWVKDALGLQNDAELLQEMRVLVRSDEGSSDVYGGSDAVIFLARLFWWSRPLAWLSGWPGFRGLLDSGYRFVASRRRCSSGSCMRK